MSRITRDIFFLIRCMIVRDIQHILESWAPKELAWERDNAGLQIGSEQQRIRKILVALDVTDEVVNEARQKKIDLLISHHPLIFSPLKFIRSNDRVGRLTLALARNNISLYSAHTNLDFTTSGVSSALAERLELQNIKVLLQQNNVYKKIVVFVPSEFAEKIMSAMAKAGAGKVGNYDTCSFQTNGTGTFRGLPGTKPFIGKSGSLETTPEVRLETIAQSWKINNVIKAMKAAHPYEEAAYDLYDLANVSNEFGAGIIGELKKSMSLKSFLSYVQRKLHVKGLRYTTGSRPNIRRVAVCGGSGSDLLQHAIREQTDAFVTADVKYHSFQQAEDAIALIDAGHYETEVPIIEKIVDYLKEQISFRKERIQVFASQQIHNPVNYYFS